MVTEAWLPVELASALTESALQRAPLYELLADAGVVVDRIRHEITAEIADAPHHHLSVLLSPNRSRVLLSQTADELEMADGLTIAHDVATPR